jgi:hypothetical protein
MGVAHQLARLTAQSPPMELLPAGGIPEVTREMVALAAASLDDDLAYHLVMGRYMDSIASKSRSLPLIEQESQRIWVRANRGQIRKLDSFDRLTVLVHATYFNNPEGRAQGEKTGRNTLTAAERARFCNLSESTWHSRWGQQFADLVGCLDGREGCLMRWIAKNIWRME